MSESSADERRSRLVTVEAYSRHWLSDGQGCRSLQVTTVANYWAALQARIVPVIGDIPLVELRPWHVCHLLVCIQDSGYSPTTGRHAISVLKSMLWQAKRDGLVSRNVAAQVKGPRRSWPSYLAVNGHESVDRTNAAVR